MICEVFKDAGLVNEFARLSKPSACSHTSASGSGSTSGRCGCYDCRSLKNKTAWTARETLAAIKNHGSNVRERICVLFSIEHVNLVASISMIQDPIFSEVVVGALPKKHAAN